MYELKKKLERKIFTSKFVGTGPSSYKKGIYRAAVSQRLRNTGVRDGIHFIHTVKKGGRLTGLVTSCIGTVF